MNSGSWSWDWLLMNMITYGITDYYQINVCNNYTDFVLYKLGRARGTILPEVHIIQRSSAHCYRMMSFDFDQVTYHSFRTPPELCKYIVDMYIPEEVKPVGAVARLEELRERRRQRAEQFKREGYLDGEIYTTYEEWCGYSQKHDLARRKEEYEQSLKWRKKKF